MRRVAALLMVLGVLFLLAAPASATAPPPNPNQVEFWCPFGGVKYEEPGTPFTVPAPPEGQVWVLLVLKAGSDPLTENELFAFPTPGVAYSRTDLKTISHAILCLGPSDTTTTSPTTTQGDEGGTTTTSTSTTSTTSTTQPTTTVVGTNPLTVPTTPTTLATTTTAGGGGAGGGGSTTTAVTSQPTVPTSPGTTVQAPTTTASRVVAPPEEAPPTVVTPTTLPVTGAGADRSLLLVGLVLLGAGLVMLAVSFR